MMICSEGTRDSRGASPRLWQRAGLMLVCLVGGLSAWALPAAAQHVDYFWSVVDGSTTLQPGESVTLQLNARRTPDFPDTTHYAGGKFTVLISGWGATDTLATNTDGTLGRENTTDTSNNYLGRKPNLPTRGFRNFPSQLGYLLQPKSMDTQELISDLPDQSITHAQVGLKSWDISNPNDFFRVQFIAGNSIGSRIFDSAFTVSQVGINGIPAPATFTNGSFTITVVPDSSVVSFLMISIGIFWMRSRRL